jgi:hypothetical protein
MDQENSKDSLRVTEVPSEFVDEALLSKQTPCQSPTFHLSQPPEPEVLAAPETVVKTTTGIEFASVDKAVPENVADTSDLIKAVAVPIETSPEVVPAGEAAPEPEVKIPTDPIIETDTAPVNEADSEHLVDTSDLIKAVAVTLETSPEAVSAGKVAPEPEVKITTDPIIETGTAPINEADPKHDADSSDLIKAVAMPIETSPEAVPAGKAAPELEMKITAEPFETVTSKPIIEVAEVPIVEASPEAVVKPHKEPLIKATQDSVDEQKNQLKKFMDFFTTKCGSEPEVTSETEIIDTVISEPITEAAAASIVPPEALVDERESHDDEPEARVDEVLLSKETLSSKDKPVLSVILQLPEPEVLVAAEPEVKTTTEPIIERDLALVNVADPEHLVISELTLEASAVTVLETPEPGGTPDPVSAGDASPEPDVKASTEPVVEQKSPFKKFFDFYSTKQASEPEVKSLTEPSIVTDTSGPIIKAAVDDKTEAHVDAFSLSKESLSEDKPVPSVASESPEHFSLTAPEPVETDPVHNKADLEYVVDTSELIKLVEVPIETSPESVPASEAKASEAIAVAWKWMEKNGQSL